MVQILLVLYNTVGAFKYVSVECTSKALNTYVIQLTIQLFRRFLNILKSGVIKKCFIITKFRADRRIY